MLLISLDNFRRRRFLWPSVVYEGLAVSRKSITKIPNNHRHHFSRLNFFALMKAAWSHCRDFAFIPWWWSQRIPQHCLHIFEGTPGNRQRLTTVSISVILRHTPYCRPTFRQQFYGWNLRIFLPRLHHQCSKLPTQKSHLLDTISLLRKSDTTGDQWLQALPFSRSKNGSQRATCTWREGYSRVHGWWQIGNGINKINYKY